MGAMSQKCQKATCCYSITSPARAKGRRDFDTERSPARTFSGAWAVDHYLKAAGSYFTEIGRVSWLFSHLRANLSDIFPEPIF
jgi:hypothetical protein